MGHTVPDPVNAAKVMHATSPSKIYSERNQLMKKMRRIRDGETVLTLLKNLAGVSTLSLRPWNRSRRSESLNGFLHFTNWLTPATDSTPFLNQTAV